jgi:hypothetical protein
VISVVHVTCSVSRQSRNIKFSGPVSYHTDRTVGITARNDTSSLTIDVHPTKINKRNVDDHWIFQHLLNKNLPEILALSTLLINIHLRLSLETPGIISASYLQQRLLLGLILGHALKTYEGLEVQFGTTWEVSGQLHAPVGLPRRKNLQVPNG